MPPDFRYGQFCSLARAAEILGERWTIPLLRELFAHPQRFSDLRRRLPGLSPSVLTERLERLGQLGVIARRRLAPPAASDVYELTEAGRALKPALLELTRWGVRFLGAPLPADRIEADWLRLGLEAFARTRPSPAIAVEVGVAREAGEAPLRLHVSGGPGGTRVGDAGPPTDVAFVAPPLLVLGLASGRLPVAAFVSRPDCAWSGDRASLEHFPELFDLPGSG